MLVLLEKKVPFKVVNINLTKKPSWFLENTWGTVSVIRCLLPPASCLLVLTTILYFIPLLPVPTVASLQPLHT